jgi:hypothetical protein
LAGAAMGAPARAGPLLAWLLLCCPVERGAAGPRKKKDEDTSKVAMAHHSFATPLAFEEVLSDWRVSGASIVERERVLLHPSVPERAAFLWNKLPVLSNDFEATVHFRVTGPKDTSKVTLDQSFGLWYVYENISQQDIYNETAIIRASSWKAGMDELGFTFSGFKAKFHGFGGILSMADANKVPKAMVSGIWNDGDRELVYGPGKDAPAANAKGVEFRNTMNAAQFKIRVTPTSIEGHLKQSPSLSWNECFVIDRKKDPVKPGGYIGFTAWSGTSAPPYTVSDTVAITHFEVYNHDTTSIGEEMKDVSKEIQEAYREMLTDDNRHFADQKSQKEHIARLVQMLSEHANSTGPADQKMFEDLQGLQDRMGRLDEDCRTLTKELQVLVGPKGDVGLKDEIVGLRRLFIKDSASHRQKLDTVQKNIAEVKQRHIDASKPEMFTEVAKQSEHLQATVNSRSSQSVGMLLAIIGAIIVIGCLMYNRMQYYERKHFL